MVPGKTTNIGETSPNEANERLVDFLKGNVDIFAWSYEDMPGINPSVTMHRPNVNLGAKLIRQKKRTMDAACNAATTEKVAKLLKVGFIRKVRYPTSYPM